MVQCIGIVAAEIRPQYFELLRNIATEYSVPFLIQPRPSSPNYAEFVEQVRLLSPDLIIVNSYSLLIRSDILAIPAFGAVNIHGALLPQYRGSNPTQWALLNNEVETGVTMHYMDAQFDTGDIIVQRRVPIYFDDTWCDIQKRIGVATEAMLDDELPDLLNKSIFREPQDESIANYYRRRHPEDGQINWELNVLHIYNLIRALVKPHPGAFYIQNGKKITIDKYLSVSEVINMKYGMPGGQLLKFRSIHLEPRDSQAQNNPLLFDVYDSVKEKLIGNCGLVEIDWKKKVASVQISVENHIKQNDLFFILEDFAKQQLELVVMR